MFCHLEGHINSILPGRPNTIVHPCVGALYWPIENVNGEELQQIGFMASQIFSWLGKVELSDGPGSTEYKQRTLGIAGR